jgi:hypothetical protein
MSYFGDGAAQGLLQLSNVFGNMLAQRMNAGFEDAQEQKRLEAANKAELEKIKALEEWKKTQIAESRPFAGPDGQVMVQDVNYAGGVIGPARPARADESFGFTMAQEKLKQEKALAEARLGKDTAATKKYETDAKLREQMAPLEMELKKAQTGAASRANRPNLATPKSSARDTKELASLERKINKLIPLLREKDAADIQQQMATINRSIKDADGNIIEYDEPVENKLASYNSILTQAENMARATLNEDEKKSYRQKTLGIQPSGQFGGLYQGE